MGPAGPIMAEKLAIAILAHAFSIVAMHKALINIVIELLGNITWDNHSVMHIAIYVRREIAS